MNALKDHIRDVIHKRGPISFAVYMELALQHPEYGYYRKGDPLGREGDFITAPEISQMFGEMIGLWCAETWRALDKPEKFVLGELGPGHGTLMHDLLRATTKVSGFREALELYLIESNETLREVQKEKLSGHNLHYVDSLTQLPAMPTIVIANEFFDAMPIRQLEKTSEGWCERLVGDENGRFILTFSPPDPSFAFMIPPDIREASVGTVHEFSLPALGAVGQLAEHLVKYKGAALIIDYGYTAPPSKATLQAVSRHGRAEVLEQPGDVDLTAHVDFTALRHLAEARGAHINGPLGQGEFLEALGITMRALQLKHKATPPEAKDIDSALQRLCDPAHMGTLFKVMAITTPHLGTLVGF